MTQDVSEITAQVSVQLKESYNTMMSGTRLGRSIFKGVVSGLMEKKSTMCVQSDCISGQAVKWWFQALRSLHSSIQRSLEMLVWFGQSSLLNSPGKIPLSTSY
ncbi:hypothetical protein CEXT_696131 [Caerostris extrusa]|uniref:Uncharacterized protein n=1 Tax=Caerostris extrusa TaxID=172846 RepID=A0AAV4WJX3_CAEEX|nr:hypothetical protein CEXT_696131 [Caerostris extrusa]